MIELDVRRGHGPGGPELQVEAVFPLREGPWEVALPCWRPGRYELANFAQYVLSMEALVADGEWVRLRKASLHRWQVPDGVARFRWRFHAGILNAGSTYVGEEVLYLNQVNWVLFDPDRLGLGYRMVLSDVPEGWEVNSLSSICQQNPKTLKLSERLPFINYLETSGITKNVITETLLLTEKEQLPSRAKKFVSKNEIIEIGPNDVWIVPNHRLSNDIVFRQFWNQ
jgi:hypothetical protein